MGKLFQYDINKALEKKIEEIVDYIMEVFLSTDKIKKIQIQDPYYSLEIFLDILEKYFKNTDEFIPNQKKIWENIFGEFFEEDSIEEIEILSQIRESEFPILKKIGLERYNAQFIDSNEIGFQINIRNKIIRFYTYLHLKAGSELGYGKNEPNIHDRFILYHFENGKISGLHIGCSLKDIHDKDVLCTKILSDLAKELSIKYDVLKGGRTG